MKIKEGFVLRKVGGRNIVVATGKASQDFNGMIRINDVGALIWSRLAEGTEVNEIVRSVVEKYDIDIESAKNDVNKFINKLNEAGFIE